MQIAVLGNAGSWYVADLTQAAARAGHGCVRMDYERLTAVTMRQRTIVRHEDAALHGFDAVLVRTMPPGSLEQVVFRMDALLVLQAAGVPVINPPRAIECAVDKYLCTARLADAQLPVPPTSTCETADDALAAFAELGGDVVVKPLFGAEGRGIMRVSDPELALRTFRTLERLDAVIYLQQFVPHNGFDVRVLVLDGVVLGAIERHSRDDFRTNVSRTAVPMSHELSDDESDLALRAANAVGARIAGVDLLYDVDGTCRILEVNAVPGWRAFRKVTGIDVAEHLIAAIAEEQPDVTAA
jgi:ribosomal protein S6--L-glutamate ligase